MIVYAAREMAAQWRASHPELVEQVERFDVYAKAQGLPDTTLTELWRTVDENVAIYVRLWLGLQEKVARGEGLELGQRKEYDAIQGLSRDALAELARARPSNHLWRCAADIRTKHYNAKQMALVRAWWWNVVAPGNKRDTRWEFLVHDVHGMHLHVGRRDAEWKAKYDPRNGGTTHA